MFLPSEGKRQRWSEFQNSVSTLREIVTSKGDTLPVACAAASVYLDLIDRVVVLLSQLDGAYESEHPNPTAIRSARLALRDEQRVFNLVDRAVRGLCDSIGMRTRIWFEESRRPFGIEHQDPSEELNALRMEHLMFETFYDKARVYGLPMFDWKPLRELMLEVQRNKENSKEIEDDDLKAMRTILQCVARDLNQSVKAVADQICQEGKQKVDRNKSGESAAEGGN